MPFFRTTKDIFVTPWEDELFDQNWFDSRDAYIPPTKDWDYSRELTIHDVDIWEMIYYESGGTALYAAWTPFAEFYMLTQNLIDPGNSNVETFYGEKASVKAYYKARQIGMPVCLQKTWVDDNKLWLY